MDDPFSLLKGLAAEYWGIHPRMVDCLPFGKGASGRTLCRLTAPCGQTFVGVRWNLDRADNDAFVPAARYLQQGGVTVPVVSAYEVERDSEGCHAGGMALIQDFGDRDLLSLKEEPWSVRREWYVKAMAEVNKLHHLPVAEHFQPPFDEELYLWEQGYFAEYFLGQHLGRMDWESFTEHQEMKALRRRLASLPRVPVHRDFQSQNIMIFGEKVGLIDFQGMRPGLAEYDLASLLYDPYAGLTREQREDLLREWRCLSSDMWDEAVFYDCACQRLMQAMGCYANIGYNKRNDWYLSQIPPSRENLREVLSITKLAGPWEFVLS